MEILWLEIMILVVGFEDTKYVDLNILRLGYFLFFFFFKCIGSIKFNKKSLTWHCELNLDQFWLPVIWHFLRVIVFYDILLSSNHLQISFAYI